jgi:peptidoglycan/LPS O-acetylase OafA/YrhL
MRKGGYVPELDGLRAIAIGLVMLYHFWTYTGTELVGRAMGRVALAGWAGVDLFFVLSGFLITGILLDARGTAHRWRSFVLRRALRIFPLYYAVLFALLTASLAIKAFHIGIDNPDVSHPERLGWNFLYLTNVAQAIHGTNWVPLDIAWSLAVEEQFYLLFPLLVFSVSERRLAQVLGGAVLVAVAFRVGWFLATADPIGPYALLPARMDQLAIGGLAALALRHPSTPWAKRIRVAALPLALGAIAMLAWQDRSDLAFIAVGYTLTGLAGAAVVVTIVQGGWPVVKRGLALRPLVWVGKVSYGLYLFHVFAREAIQRAPVIGDLPSDSLPAAILLTGLMTALACALAALS